MSTKWPPEQRYGQPRDFMRVVPKSRKKHAHIRAPSPPTFGSSSFSQQKHRSGSFRSCRSDIKYDESTSSSVSEEESDAEYISHQDRSREDSIAPYSSSSRRENVSYSYDDRQAYQQRPPRASPPTRVPFATFNDDRLESHRKPEHTSHAKKSKKEQRGKKKSKKKSSQNLEIWGFGGHDDGAMSLNEQSASRSRRHGRMAGEFPSSDIDEHPQYHIEDDTASDIASVHSESESGHAVPCSSTTPSSFSVPRIKAKEKPSSDEDETSEDFGSDIQVVHPDQSQSSFSVPIPRRKKPREIDYSSDSHHSGVQIHRPRHQPHSLPAPRAHTKQKPRKQHLIASIPHEHPSDEVSQSSFSAPIIRRSRTTQPKHTTPSFCAPMPRRTKTTTAAPTSTSHSFSTPHTTSHRPTYTSSRSYPTQSHMTRYDTRRNNHYDDDYDDFDYASDIQHSDHDHDHGAHSGSDLAPTRRSYRHNDTASETESDVQDCIESAEDEQCIGSGYDERPRRAQGYAETRVVRSGGGGYREDVPRRREDRLVRREYGGSAGEVVVRRSADGEGRRRRPRYTGEVVRVGHGEVISVGGGGGIVRRGHRYEERYDEEDDEDGREPPEVVRPIKIWAW